MLNLSSNKNSTHELSQQRNRVSVSRGSNKDIEKIMQIKLVRKNI